MSQPLVIVTVFHQSRKLIYASDMCSFVYSSICPFVRLFLLFVCLVTLSISQGTLDPVYIGVLPCFLFSPVSNVLFNHLDLHSPRPSP